MSQVVTKPVALDETLQATNTALGLLGKDTTLQSIVTALASIGVNTVGNLASLVTTDKSSLVGAVNEVNGGKVSKSGDTMTGDLAINKASADLSIRASGSRFSHIKSNASGDDRTNYLPNKDGTLATTDDVDSRQPKTLETPLTIGGTQQTTVEGALGKLTENTERQIISTEVLFTSSTSLTYTGVNFTVPAGKCYCINVCAVFENSQPEEILVSEQGATDARWYVHARSTDSVHVIIGGYAPNNITFYVFAKYNGESQNLISLQGWYF